MEFPAVCGDVSFGPSVKSADCRGGFDFTGKKHCQTDYILCPCEEEKEDDADRSDTVLFEETILTILPAALFILLTPFRALRLIRRRLKVRRNALYISKLVIMLHDLTTLGYIRYTRGHTLIIIGNHRSLCRSPGRPSCID